ncbi:MAG: hypothetical protein FJY88_06155 [Candidatus Eisenbacteria bacterium]|nr:hypothetical protein [Candidatus Eisenbacteria bacterium]
MRRGIALGLLIAVAVASAASAEEVRVYCKDGSRIEGELLKLSAAGVRIDPTGPIASRMVEAAQIDSVVSVGGDRRLLFPLAAEGDLGQLRTGHSRSGVRVHRRFTLAGYGTYRAPKPVETLDPELDAKLQVDGSFGAGFMAGWYLPTGTGGSAMLTDVFLDVGMLGETISVTVPGGRLGIVSMNYLVLDLGLRPMFPLAGERTRLYLAPMAGLGVRITNIRGGTTSQYALYSSTPSFDASGAFLFGAGLDLVGSSALGASLRWKASQSKLFLERSAYLTHEIQIVFSFLSYD